MQAAKIEVLWDVVEEHLDEAEFLWEVWEHSLVAPNYTLDEVASGPEARLLAHIDGLVVNGPEVATRLLIPTLNDAEAEPFRVRAAALALLTAPGTTGVDAVMTALEVTPARHEDLARALECCERADVRERLRALLRGQDPELRGAAARVLCSHHEPLGELLPVLLASERVEDRRLAIAALPFEADAGKHARQVVRALKDPATLDAALTAGALLRLPEAWSRARALVDARDPACGQALLLLALRGDPGDHARVIAAVGEAGLRAAGLWAIGFLGTAAAAEACLPWLDDEAHAKLAGEAFAAITGVDLEEAGLVRAAGEEQEALEWRAEDELPVPDAEAVRAWWGRRRGESVAVRPVDAQTGLRAGAMRRRAAHLLAWWIAGRGRERVALQAWSERQRRELARVGPAASRPA